MIKFLLIIFLIIGILNIIGLKSMNGKLNFYSCFYSFYCSPIILVFTISLFTKAFIDKNVSVMQEVTEISNNKNHFLKKEFLHYIICTIIYFLLFKIYTNG